jgi:hypothetical protein
MGIPITGAMETTMPEDRETVHDMLLDMIVTDLKENGFEILINSPREHHNTIRLVNGVLIQVYKTYKIVVQGNPEKKSKVFQFLKDRYAYVSKG